MSRQKLAENPFNIWRRKLWPWVHLWLNHQIGRVQHWWLHRDDVPVDRVPKSRRQ